MKEFGIISIVIAIFVCAGASLFIGDTSAQLEETVAGYEADVWESREAIAEAQPDIIAAEGYSAAMQELTGSAVRAIDRQGKLLTLYIVGGQVRSFGSGLFVGAIVATAIFLLAPRVSVELKKRNLEY